MTTSKITKFTFTILLAVFFINSCSKYCLDEILYVWEGFTLNAKTQKKPVLKAGEIIRYDSLEYFVQLKEKLSDSEDSGCEPFYYTEDKITELKVTGNKNYNLDFESNELNDWVHSVYGTDTITVGSLINRLNANASNQLGQSFYFIMDTTPSADIRDFKLKIELVKNFRDTLSVTSVPLTILSVEEMN
ncbi:MAG: hypothetical protein MI784_04875 [Cytophagales bacterium]|nr:hypothetical protein [Cytophagales bacterium]